MTVNKNSNKAPRLEMVKVDQNQFYAEIMNGNATVNMTMMSVPFGREKRPANWLKTAEAKSYIEAVAVATRRATADLLQVRQGGTQDKQGTWCTDYRIAMRYAQWLSPEFSIRVDEVLIRLMRGDAVMAEKINGVEPIILDGSLWYNYADVLRSYNINRSSAYRRKAKFPDAFRLIYGRNFITREYFILLQKFYAYKNAQLLTMGGEYNGTL